jgi:hypothetical protein
VNYSTLNFDGQKALRLKGFNTVCFDLSRRQRRTIKRDTNLVGKMGIKNALAKLSRLEIRAPEVSVCRTESSGRWRPHASACEYFVSVSVRKFWYSPKVLVRHRKFQLVQFARALVCERIVSGSIRKFRYVPEVSVLAPKVLVNPSCLTSPTV